MTERHSDPFFESVRNELYNLEVAPPQSAYSGMRKKMNSTSGWFSMNALAAALILGAMVAGTLYLTDEGQAEALSVQSNAPQLDAVLSTGQSRLQDRDQLLDRKAETKMLREAASQSTPTTASAVLAASETKPRAAVNRSIPTTSPLEVTPEPTELHGEPKEEIREADLNLPAAEQPALLPNNWSEQVGTVNPSEIMQQVSDGSDVIHLSIPVKVSVEDKD